MLRKSLPLLICGGLLAASCDQNSSVSKQQNSQPAIVKTIDPPLVEATLPYDTYTVDPAVGGTIITQKGTEIIFPADAFVYENGEKVDKPVQVQFREFHSASDIILSGITMTAKDINGESYPFESAGMFDIQAQCEDKPLQVAVNKKIGVNLVSTKKDTDFNFYALDKKDGWKELSTNTAVSNNPRFAKNKIEAEKTLSVEPIAPEKFDNTSFVFDLDMDTQKYPELKELYGLMWQYNGKKGSNTDPESNKKIVSNQWTYSEILRNGDLTFTLWLRNKKESVHIPVKPVLSGKNYAEAKARYDKKMKNYRAAVDRKEAAQKAINEGYEYTRQLQVSGFGIFNCDRFYKMPNVKTIQKPMFAINSENLPAGTIIFHIAKEDVIIRLYNTEDAFKYGSSEKNRLLALLPDKTVATLSKQDFQIAVDASGKKTFNLKKQSLGQITPELLGEVIKSI